MQPIHAELVRKIPTMLCKFMDWEDGFINVEDTLWALTSWNGSTRKIVAQAMERHLRNKRGCTRRQVGREHIGQVGSHKVSTCQLECTRRE